MKFHSFQQPLRRGFTLIELLVAFAVLALLMALLLPAVQQSRESAHRMACRNHLRQLGLAVHQYHDVHGRYPPASLLGNLHNINEMLLPYLDQTPLFTRIDFQRDNLHPVNAAVLGDVYLAVQTCPSNVRGGARGGYDGMLSQGAAYQPCAGPYRFPLGPDRSSDCFKNGLPGYCFGPGVSSSSGIFGLAIAGPHPSCRIRDVTDGLGNTLMFGEVLPQFNLFHGLWSAQACGFITAMAPNSPGRIEPATSMIPAVSYQDALNQNHGLASGHIGGVHVLRGDGSVTFLNNSIDFRTYNYLGNKSDGQVIAGD